MSSTWIDFIDFHRFVSGKINRKFLIDQKKISRPTLFLKFKRFFDLPLSAEIVWQILPPKLLSSNRPWIYGADGKWLRKFGVTLNHRDITNQENIWWSNHSSESYEAYHQDLSKLSVLIGNTHLPSGAISDWKGAAVAGVSSHFGNIPHQRCLVHVLRTLKRLLPENSPIMVTLELREISKEIVRLDDEIDVWHWQEKLIDWEIKYGQLLTTKTRSENTKKKWWYTHGNLRRAWRLLTLDQDPFSIYLTNNLIPRSNNSLEGVNSQLKQKLGDHRGMKHNQQVSFVFWHFTFSRVKNHSDLKKLWVAWKKLYNLKNQH